MMEENREGLGMQVIAVMVQRYGVLPKEMWDLNSTSDMGAGRGVNYNRNLSQATFKRIISNVRYNTINLSIGGGISHKVPLPDTLRRLTILGGEYNDTLDPLPESLYELIFERLSTYDHSLVLPQKLRKLQLRNLYNEPLTLPPQLAELELGSSYDHPLHLPQHLKQLKFHLESCFNHPIVLPAELRKLALGHSFDQPLTLPPLLVELEFGWGYSHPVVLPAGIKRLVFHWGCPFDHPIALPPSLVAIYFGDSYNQPTILPSELEEFGVGAAFTHEVSLPDSLRKIEWRCNWPIDIPEGVSEMTFSFPFDLPVTFPSSVKKVAFEGVAYSHPLELPTSLEQLTWYHADYDDLVLPEDLHKLTWISTCNVSLPSGLKELELCESAPLVLPEGLLKVTFRGSSQGHYDLPESIREVVLSKQYPFEITVTHPTTLLHFSIVENVDTSSDHEVCEVDLSHMSIHKLTIGNRRTTMKHWPQELKELEFTVDGMEHPLRVPKGCRIVGGRRPRNVIIME